MISERWEDVFAVFDAAVATSGVERDALLARECGDNARLRGKVESLLAAHQDAEGFLSGGLARDHPGLWRPVVTRLPDSGAGYAHRRVRGRKVRRRWRYG